MWLSELAKLAVPQTKFSIPFLQKIFIYFNSADCDFNPVKVYSKAVGYRFDFKSPKTGSCVHYIIVPPENALAAAEQYQRGAKLIGLEVSSSVIAYEEQYLVDKDINWYQLQTFLGTLEMKKLMKEYGFNYGI